MTKEEDDNLRVRLYIALTLVEREEAREMKNYAEADETREWLEKAGFIVMDSKDKIVAHLRGTSVTIVLDKIKKCVTI